MYHVKNPKRKQPDIKISIAVFKVYAHGTVTYGKAMKCIANQQVINIMIKIFIVSADLCYLCSGCWIWRNSNSLSEHFLFSLLLSLRILHTVSFQAGLPIFSEAYSSGVRFFLSTIFKSAPLMRRWRISLVDWDCSDARTPRWRGVRPLKSRALTFAPQAKI